MIYGRASQVVVCGLLLAGAARVAEAQGAITVTGRVSSDAGLPLADASIELRALGLGALTRGDGRYSFSIPAGRQAAGTTVTLTARRLGYRTLTRQVALPAGGGTVSVDFTLVTNPLQLGEIVVTGAGTSTAVERLGAIRKTVDSSLVTRSNEVNLVTALAGKAAGVQIQQQSGEAGGGARIQIRGVRSVQNANSQPLFIVDGVPINNNTTFFNNTQAVSGTSTPNRAADINPNDIESLEILSGPSAAAVYGSLAGNGVVIITTKKGRAGRTTYSLRSSYGTEEPTRTLPYQRRFGVGTGGAAPACVTGGPTNCFLSAGFFSWGAPIAAGTQTWNQIDRIFDTGSTWDNTLTVQGGNERTTFLMSGGLLDQNGYYITDNDMFRRLTGRLNASHKATDELTVSGNVLLARTDMNAFGRGNNTNGMLLPALRTPPDFDNANFAPNGLHRSWRFPNPVPGSQRLNRGFDNPFYVINAGETAPQAADRTIGNLALNWTPLSWLSVDYNLGADFTAEDRLEARPEQASGTPVGGSVTRWQFNQRNLDHNLTARATREWGENLTTRVLVGQQLNQQHFRQIYSVGNTLVAPLPYRLDNTTTQVPPTDAETKTRLESYFGQVQFDLFRQLFVTLLARNDGSSTFGTETNRIWYPNAQLAWNVTEAFRVPGISTAKLRAAYGETGIPVTAYQLQSVYLGGTNQIVDFSPGSVLVPNVGGFGGLFASTIRGNNRLEPARVGEIEVGGDFAFLNNRIDAGVTYYVQQTRGGIVNAPLSPSTGFTSEVRNAVRMRNIGLELQGNVRVLQTRDWQLDVGGNYAFNRNRVQSLGDSAVQTLLVGAPFGGRSTFAQVGQQLGVIRGSDFARCRYGEASNRVGGVDINAACRTANAPDGALYIGTNGFPIADPTERLIGDPNPNYTAGVRTGLTFRRLSLNSFWDIRRGGTIQNMTKASMYNYGTHGDTEDRGRTAVFGQNYRLGGVGPASFPVVGPGAGREVTIGESWYAGTGGIGGPVSPFQEDGSYVRLRELSLGITLDQRFVQRSLGMSSIDLRLAGRNLGLWTDYTGFDPETSLSGGAVITQGFDWFNAPTARSFVISVGLNR